MSQGTHVIANLSFREDWVDCTCGTRTNVEPGWNEHLKSVPSRKSREAEAHDRNRQKRRVTEVQKAFGRGEKRPTGERT